MAPEVTIIEKAVKGLDIKVSIPFLTASFKVWMINVKYEDYSSKLHQVQGVCVLKIAIGDDHAKIR